MSSDHVRLSATGTDDVTAEQTGGATTLHDLSNDLTRRRLRLIEGGRDDGPGGRLHARERIDLLLDQGSFREIERFRRHQARGFGLENNRPETDGVITGWGTVLGRKVFVFAQDARVLGGSLGATHAAKIHQVQDMAAAVGAPIVGIKDSGGARIQEGTDALVGYGGIFRRNVASSGVIPQISVILGPCAGGASYSPALTDFVFMVDKTSQMFLTGPDVIREVTGEEITHDDLGGAKVHATRSGVAHFIHDSERACLEDVRYLLGQLPSNCHEAPPSYFSTDPRGRSTSRLLDIVPTDPRQAYDVREVLLEIVDDQELFEVQEHYAPNIVCGLGQIEGHVTGFVASQPSQFAGALDSKAAEKAARFVQMCDSFNIPLVTVVDVPGFMPGSSEEYDGVIRRGAKLLYAYCNATVPRVSLILRKAYGGAFIVMDSASIGADIALAWPSNEIAVMGAEAAANIVARKQIARSAQPEQTRRDFVRTYTDELMHPYYAAERGCVHDIIEPTRTREAIADALGVLRGKAAVMPDRKHGNPPQ